MITIHCIIDNLPQAPSPSINHKCFVWALVMTIHTLYWQCVCVGVLFSAQSDMTTKSFWYITLSFSSLVLNSFSKLTYVLYCHIHMFPETLLIPRPSLAIDVVCGVSFSIVCSPCAHTQSSMTKCHVSCYLQDIRTAPLICSVSLWMFANHCVQASLGLTVGQWDRLFCIQNTLASCLCRRRFHYLTGDDTRSLAMGPMATWHGQRDLPDKMMMWDYATWTALLPLCGQLWFESCVSIVWITHYQSVNNRLCQGTFGT